MVEDVNPPGSLRTAQVAETERRIVDAATRLFLAKGYPGTSLAAVAEAAGVGERTVYVRFGTKAALFNRVVDVAIVGDTEPVALMDRPEAQAALAAPTAEERLAAWAKVGRMVMERTGALFEVAQQAAAVSPEVAAKAALGREQTLAAQRMFWTRMASDGLVDPSVNLDWVIDTCGVLGAADTYTFITRLHGWDLDTYEAWLRRTMHALASPTS